MCGFAGVINYRADSTTSVNSVRRMAAELQHRGPDGSGEYISDHFIVAHKRLAIIDIAHGQQPFISPDKRYVLAFNGEIYNYKELRSELESQGFTFRTQSDTEVLLQILIAQGKSALNKLRGMFAFVFYDTHTKKWLIGRDQFGIKPIYYSVNNSQIIFGSEIKSLLPHQDITAKLNWRALQHYLTFQFYLHGETLFDGVVELEPGHYLEGNDSYIGLPQKYWMISYEIDEDHTEEYFCKELERLLNESVHMQLRTDVAVGAHLSGGIDSSIISSLAYKNSEQILPLFHGKFSQPGFDESKYARIHVEFLNGLMYETEPTPEDFVQYLPKLIRSLDQPIAGPGVFPQYMVNKLAAEHVKVLLGGQGADEIFGGYARYLIGYLEQAMKGAIFQNQEEGKHIVTLSSIIPNLPLLKNYQPLLQEFWSDGLFSSMEDRYFRLINRSPHLKNLLTKETWNQYSEQEVQEDYHKVFSGIESKSYINKMTYFDMKTLLPALLHIEDRLSMAVSIESRVPFLDTRIVELVSTMPPAIKFKGGKTKSILKQAMKEALPSEILHRQDKMGFPVPITHWMKGVVGEFIRDTLTSQKCRERGIIDTQSVDTLLKTNSASNRELWGMLSLELWFLEYMDS